MSTHVENALTSRGWLGVSAILMAFLVMPTPLQGSPSNGNKQARRGSQADAIREEVFRYQIQEDARENPHSMRPYFLALGNNVDPDDAIIKHFLGHKPPIKKVSSSEWMTHPADRQTGEDGVILEAATISWITENKVEVSGARIYGDTGGYFGVYQVVFAKGNWAVSKYVPKGIS